MKYIKTMMMALMMCFMNVSYSQNSLSDTSDFSKVEFQRIYLSDLFAGYKNCYFKFDTTSRVPSRSNTFYKEFKYAVPYSDNNVAYPSVEYNFITNADSIKGKIFKVESILDKNGNDILTIGYREKPIFKLRDVKSNEVLYYKFDTKYDHNFSFLTTEPNIESSVIDKNISKSFDEIENETTYRTPLNNVIFYRIEEKDSVKYYISLKATGTTINYNTSGVIVLFTDGTKWEKPGEKVDVSVDGSYWSYRSFILLNNDDLKLFQSKTIKKYRLYIYDNNSPSGYVFKKYAQRIDKVK